MVWHLPHLRAIARHVQGRVTLVTRPRSMADQLVGPADGIDEILWIERGQWAAQGRHNGGDGLLRLAAELRARRFDAVILLTRSRELAFASLMAGIPRRYGYGIGTQRLFLNRRPVLPGAVQRAHPFEQATAWLATAGITLAEPEPRLLVSPQAQAAMRARLAATPGPCIVLGIATSDSWKQWGAEAFASIASEFIAAGWKHLVLVGGPGEASVAADIQAQIGADQARVTTAQITTALGWPLPEVAALLQQAAFYVGNDTAALNIAAAVGTRAFGLFGATPVLRHSGRIVPIVPPGGPDRDEGMGRITVQAVLAAIDASRGSLGPGASPLAPAEDAAFGAVA